MNLKEKLRSPLSIEEISFLLNEENREKIEHLVDKRDKASIRRWGNKSDMVKAEGLVLAHNIDTLELFESNEEYMERLECLMNQENKKE